MCFSDYYVPGRYYYYHLWFTERILYTLLCLSFLSGICFFSQQQIMNNGPSHQKIKIMIIILIGMYFITNCILFSAVGQHLGCFQFPLPWTWFLWTTLCICFLLFHSYFLNINSQTWSYWVKHSWSSCYVL